MRRLLAGAAAVAAVAALTLNTSTGSADADAGCESVAVFGLGGNQDPNADIYGGAVRAVWYPASIWPVGPGPETYDDSVRQGRDNMVAAVDDYAAQCGGHIVVKGYSEGARAAGDAIEVLQNGPYADRISGVLYADPKRPGGVEDALNGLSVGGATFTGPRRGFWVPVRSECNSNDAVCDFPLWTDPIRAANNFYGYLNGGHRYNVNS